MKAERYLTFNRSLTRDIDLSTYNGDNANHKGREEKDRCDEQNPQETEDDVHDEIQYKC